MIIEFSKVPGRASSLACNYYTCTEQNWNPADKLLSRMLKNLTSGAQVMT